MQKSIFICQKCGREAGKWMGQCLGCGEWNSLAETMVSEKKKFNPRGQKSGRDFRSLGLDSIKFSNYPLQATGIEEFDRVIGGGFSPGQVILLAGEPGIGKSTLLLQVAQAAARRLSSSTRRIKSAETRRVGKRSARVLYVSGEESPEQISLRAKRLAISGEGIEIVSENNMDVIVNQLAGGSTSSRGRKGDTKFNASKYSLVIVDSIQTLTTYDLSGTAGSIGQVRECASRIIQTAKSTNTPTILTGHVTKEGAVAGPKVLEHMVDTVLYMEGDKKHLFRILRTTKNRFGDASEAGVFEMKQKGLIEVKNPSDRFLAERNEKTAGSCVTVTMEGSRPILLEIQSLVVKSDLAYPRRIVNGISLNRLHMLVAVLEKHLKIPLSKYDVYVNVASGFRITEPASDLAVCASILSSIKNRPIPAHTSVFGEIGLSGEVRKVSNEEKRIKEAKRMGFNNIVVPSKTTTLTDALKKFGL